MRLGLQIGIVGQNMSDWKYWDLPPLFNVASPPPTDPYNWTVTATSDTIFKAQFYSIHFEALLI